MWLPVWKIILIYLVYESVMACQALVPVKWTCTTSSRSQNLEVLWNIVQSQFDFKGKGHSIDEVADRVDT